MNGDVNTTMRGVKNEWHDYKTGVIRVTFQGRHGVAFLCQSGHEHRTYEAADRCVQRVLKEIGRAVEADAEWDFEDLTDGSRALEEKK